QARCKHIFCLFLGCIMMMSANAETTGSSITNLTTFTITSPNVVDSMLSNQSTFGQKKPMKPITVEKRKEGISSNKKPITVEKRKEGISSNKSKQMNLRPTPTLTSITDTIKDLHNPILNQPNGSVKLKPVFNTSTSTSKHFILKLFKRYSNENFLSIENFEKILKHVGVGILLLETSSISSVQIHRQDEEDYNHQNENETHVQIEATG
ncbi:unnamed protein product, partial [Lymnaea stagnalis]